MEGSGREIRSSDCLGFVHKARTDRGNCVGCGDPILKGQEYVRMNIFNSQDDLLHLECYVGDHQEEPIILGVRTIKIKRYGLTRTCVLCRIYGGVTVKVKK